MFINLLVSVIYLVIDNIKKINLTQNMKIKKHWYDWLKMILKILEDGPEAWKPLNKNIK